MSIEYYECVFVALVIQDAKCMCHIVMSSLVRLTLPYFFTLSHKQHYSGKKLLNIKFVF